MAQKKPPTETAKPDGPITNPVAWARMTMNIRRDLLKRVKQKALGNDTTVTKIVTAFLTEYAGRD